jgi:hypothetical protein
MNIGSAVSARISKQFSEALSASPFPSRTETPAEVVRAICEETTRLCELRFRSSLRSIVLTGSLARGEGSFTRHDESWQLHSDAEFVVVLTDSTPLPKPAEQGEIQKTISDALSGRDLHCSVSLAVVHADFLRKLQPSIFAYELRNCGQCVVGDPGVLTEIPAFSVAQIRLEDAWRLLCNRMIEQLESVAESNSGNVSSELFYRTVKLYLDMATSLLLFLGDYEPSYRMRAERLRSLSRNARSKALPFELSEFAQTVDTCTQWKLSLSTKPAHGSNHDLLLSSQRHATRLLQWELSRLTGLVGSRRDLTKKWISSQRLNERIRGWAYVLRASGWLRSWRQWPRWIRCAVQGSPRYLIYSAANEIYVDLPLLLSDQGGESQMDPILQKVEDLLPVVDGSGMTSRNWRRSAGMCCSNYHRFLENTRS